ncbi:MAG TPA: VOC family protein [Candidatus Baltobacteraceae bacterium]|jgi:methylmalonyl-CoA/ethylmalonyl-CoA epimerase|nr:VOC family protein [Candidatus Baltobacteraceae bacterium]
MFGYRFHHVGIACDDIDATAEYVRQAYEIISDTGTIFDPQQNASLRLFNEGEAGAIELVSGAPVAKLLKRGTTYYHICYTVPDLEVAIERAQSVGAVCVSPPKPAILFGGRRVAFIYTPFGLVEFLERSAL